MPDSSKKEQLSDMSAMGQDVASALRHLVHTSNDVTCVYSPDLKNVRFISDAYERIWGRSPASLRKNPRSWIEAVHPEDAERVKKDVSRGIRLGERFDEVYRIVRPDGDVRVIRHLGFPLRNEEGTVWAAAGIARDITVERRAGEEADEYARQMQLLAETAMAFIELPHDAPIYELIGAKMHELCGKSSYVVVTEFSPDERTYETRALLGFGDALETLRARIGPQPLLSGKVVEAVRQAWLSGKFALFEGGMAALLGSQFPADVAHAAERELGVEATYKIGFSRGGRVFGGVTIALRDANLVPKPEVVEAFIRQATVVLERRESQLQLRASEAQFLHAQKMEAIGRLAGGMAHDLNNMLGTIIGYADALVAELEANNPIRRDVQQILAAGERATQITEQLRAFSHRQIAFPRLTNVEELITEIEPMLGRLLGEEVSLNTSSSATAPHTLADRNQLKQLMMNLVLNARDAMLEGGRIDIEVKQTEADENAAERLSLAPGTYVLIAVHDTGCGIDSETQQRIFEPFFTTKPEGQGTGLGLSTAYGIASQSGGTMTVSSNPGEGSVFRVYLPWAEEETPSETPPPARTEGRGDETVLVAEDEALLRNLMVRVLEAAGYRVMAANDGEHALELCQAYDGPIHLLVSDIVMPRLGGRELAQQVLAQLPSIKVLFTSGYMGSSAARQGEGIAKASFIAKPFTGSAFLAKVREALESS